MILDLVRQYGRVGVEELSAQFGVSPQTIRKDLNELCDDGTLVRVHGGAIIGNGVSNVGYEARRLIAHKAKERIGLCAAGLIRDNSSLFINIGTTTEAVAAALKDRNDLLVITNNLNVANILREAPGVDVIIVGGLLRRSDGGIVGEAALDMIRQFKLDYAVVGISAIDPDGTLLDYDYREVRISQAILSNARHSILVADGTKFTRRAPVRVAHLSEIQTFVTDAVTVPEIRALCASAGVDLHEVDRQSPHSGLGDADDAA